MGAKKRWKSKLLKRNSWRWKWTTVLWSDKNSFLEITDTASFRLKMRGTIQFVASLMVRRCIICYGTDKLHIWNGSINAESYLQIFQITSFSAWVRRAACSPELSPTENISNTTKKTHDCWAARILYQTRMGQHSFHNGPAAGLFSSQMLKEEEMLHSGKHGAFPTD